MLNKEALLLLTAIKVPYTKISLSGSGTWTVPKGVKALKITLAGGGGKNGSGVQCGGGTAKYCSGGRGGRGGLYVGTFTTTPKTSYSYSVGGVGGTTSFGSYKATGGGAGSNATGSNIGSKYCECSSGSNGSAGTPTGNGATSNNAGWLYVEYGEGISV